LDIVLNNCNVIDLEGGSVNKNVNIQIINKVIKGIKSCGTWNSEKTINMNGAFVIPGLFNVHTHLSILFPSNQITVLFM